MRTKLQAQRHKKGYTQKEVAQWAGIPLQTLQKLEIGANKIDSLNITYLLALCRELECGLEDILESDENRFAVMMIYKIGGR